MRREFQFHTGSIKALHADNPGVSSGNGFQFHTGSIKASPRPAPVPRHKGFNSTLVRLKRQTAEKKTFFGLDSFNSTLVRLKL